MTKELAWAGGKGYGFFIAPYAAPIGTYMSSHVCTYRKCGERSHLLFQSLGRAEQLEELILPTPRIVPRIILVYLDCEQRGYYGGHEFNP